MKPLRISPRITLQLIDTHAQIESNAEIHLVEAFIAVAYWVETNQVHPRWGDAQMWLSAFEEQNPKARPPVPRPLSQERQEKVRWSEATIKYYQKEFGMPEETARRIIIAMVPEFSEILGVNSDQD